MNEYRLQRRRPLTIRAALAAIEEPVRVDVVACNSRGWYVMTWDAPSYLMFLSLTTEPPPFSDAQIFQTSKTEIVTNKD